MDKCNGWVNYPTWALYNWILNDEYLYKSYVGFIKELREDCNNDLLDMKDKMSRIIKTNLEYHNPFDEAPVSIYTDILQWAIDVIDYYDIACAMIEGWE